MPRSLIAPTSLVVRKEFFGCVQQAFQWQANRKRRQRILAGMSVIDLGSSSVIL